MKDFKWLRHCSPMPFQARKVFSRRETHSNKVRRSKSYLSKLSSGFFNIYASEDRMNTFTILSSSGFFLSPGFVFEVIFIGLFSYTIKI